MSKYALLFREFNKYTELVTIEKETPTEDDVDLFLEKFLTRNMVFRFQGAAFLCANAEDPETGQKPYDMSKKSQKDALKELKPLLMQKVKEAYGSVSQDANRYQYDPEPRTVADIARDMAYSAGITRDKWDAMSESDKEVHSITGDAQVEAAKMKSLIHQYYQKVLPFMLRKTMHHPISFVVYSTSNGAIDPLRTDKDGNFITLHSEEDLQDLISDKTYRDTGFPGGKHQGIRSLLWTPSVTGRDVKMGVVDIDNPAKLPKKVMRNVTKQVALKLEEQGHPYIIMFTGNNFQIWFGEKPDEKLGDIRDVSLYLRAMLYGLGVFDANEAKEKEMVHFDEFVMSKREQGKSYQPTRMFFSLHYPIGTQSSKHYTGLAAVPVPIDELLDFDPIIHAHPENVRDNFDSYASIVSTFFDRVKIGQDYESPDELESQPDSIRMDSKHPEHDLLTHIDNTTNSIVVELDDIAKKVADEETAYVYAKARGVDAVIHFNEKGGLRFGGTALTTETTNIDAIGKKRASVRETLSAMITRTGIVIYNDYISRELERYCQAKGISELTLAGQLTSLDFMGNELDESEIQSILVRKEGLDDDEFKSLRFVVNKIVSYNHDPVPIEVMRDEVDTISSNRIIPGPSQLYTKPMGMKVKRYYQNIRNQRAGNKLVVMGEEKYLITSKRVITMAIMGVDKQSRLFQQESPELGPVWVGLMKTTSSRGPVYYIASKAEIALKREDRIKLKELVYGENNENRVPFRVHEDDITADLDIVEPRVVVDVQYDDVSKRMTNAVPFHYLQDANRASIYRAVPMERYITRLTGAKIIGIREDLNANREADVSYKQDSLIKIAATAPKTGFTILPTLPNPIEKDDMYSTFDTPLGEEIDTQIPWKMSEKAFKKFTRLAKEEQLIGYVYKKRIYYNDAKDWVMLGNNDDFFDCSMTFRTITHPFKLRGIDILSATKMCAEYGIKWHLIIADGVFYWLYCDIENSEIKAEHKKYIEDENYEGDIEETLLDLLHTVTSTYSPKEEVIDARVPGFDVSLTVMEKVKKNPAFHGVPARLDSWTPVYVDAEPLDEPRLVTGQYSRDWVHSVGGRKVSPPLIDTPTTRATPDVPAEFGRAYKRWLNDEEGFKVFVDQNSINNWHETPHYRITGLPPAFETAIDDKFGYGAQGNTIVKGDLEEIKSYKDQIDNYRLENKAQAREDAKLLASMFNYVPGGKGDLSPDAPEDKRTGPYTAVSLPYATALKQHNEDMKKVLNSQPFAHFDSAKKARGLLKNPPIKQESWDHYVNNYVIAHAKWEKTPEPKQSWEKQSVGEFPSHLVPMLEKERLLLKATSEHSLSEDEVRIINESFSRELSSNLLESPLGDLFEAEEEDEEVEYYEPEGSDFDPE